MTRRKNKSILVLNSSYEPLGFCTINEAICDIVLGTVWSLAPSQEIFFKGPIRPDGSRYMIPWPSIIVYKKYKTIEYEHLKPIDETTSTRLAILNRDNFICAYCGKPGNELEHIFPQSRGGKTSWLNCVAACRSCNSRKADKTPEEAGMKLLWTPYCPEQNKWVREQERVWKLLEQGVETWEDYE